MDEERGYNSLLSVKIHSKMKTELETISLFEHRKSAELIREWLGTKIEGFHKRPDFKNWLKQYEAKKKKRAGQV